MQARIHEGRSIQVPRSSTLRRTLALSVAVATMMTMAGTSPAPAAPAVGSLQLFAQYSEVTLHHRGDRPAFLNAGVFAEAVGGDFEIHATRTDYASPILGSQWSNGTKVQDLDPSMVDDFRGMHALIHVRVKNPNGNVVIDRDLDWCPDGYSNERVDDSGPDIQRLPLFGCYAMPFTLGTVFGIDEGWASPLGGRYGGSSDPVAISGHDGEYHVTYSFPQNVIDTFGIDPSQSKAKVAVNLVSSTHRESTPRAPRPRTQQSAAPRVPTDPNPDPSIRPDLIALPSWDIRLDRPRSGGEYLEFAANIWNAGPSPMVVEGFRQKDSATMDAYEYFYDGDTAVSRAPVGTFEFDTRPGHHHWHMEQFARYTLLNADQTEVVRSTKQSFCLFPTDAIDLTLPTADLSTPYYFGGGLSSQCGGSDAIWIRESLPVGWGDTYYQYVAGQSFRIHGLPDGRYWIQVTANPTGSMIEADTGNNTSLRRIVIRGRAGHRHVVVPAYQGIDTDGCRRCG
jgi:hypothetical protein